MYYVFTTLYKLLRVSFLVSLNILFHVCLILN